MDDKITLKNAPLGENLEIEAVTGEACKRLREIGFCEGLDLCKLSESQCIICSVCGVKYALSKDLGNSVVLTENQHQNPDQPS